RSPCLCGKGKSYRPGTRRIREGGCGEKSDSDGKSGKRVTMSAARPVLVFIISARRNRSTLDALRGGELTTACGRCGGAAALAPFAYSFLRGLLLETAL